MPRVALDVRAASIEELLIAVARPDRHEDSPERRAAWDEIKRRLDTLERERDEALGVREGLISPIQKVLQLRDRLRAVEEALRETREFIHRARPLLGIGLGNSLGAQADQLYVSLGDALAGAQAPAEGKDEVALEVKNYRERIDYFTTGQAPDGETQT